MHSASGRRDLADDRIKLREHDRAHGEQHAEEGAAAASTDQRSANQGGSKRLMVLRNLLLVALVVGEQVENVAEAAVATAREAVDR
jgi:hypothetical protein